MSHASKEAFAAFLDYSDDQIGRFVDGLRRLGRLDKTIIIVLADNGASQEGGPFGVLHEMKFFNGIIESPDDAIARLDEIGGPDSHTDYPWGWAQCGNTPYRWYKQNAHEGGVHVPMVVHWPAGVAPDQSDTLREQFVFASDIAATIYDLLGIEAPLVRNGVDQLPVAGHSFAAALADPSAPATNDVQYFEKGGSRDLSAGEWKAVCKHVAGADYDTEAWELYHLSVDRSECDDLAGTLLAILAELWWREANRHGVLPLEDRGIELFGARFRDRSPHPLSRRYVYRPPMSPLPGQEGAAIGGRSFDLIARVTLSNGDEVSCSPPGRAAQACPCSSPAVASPLTTTRSGRTPYWSPARLCLATVTCRSTSGAAMGCRGRPRSQSTASMPERSGCGCSCG